MKQLSKQIRAGKTWYRSIPPPPPLSSLYTFFSFSPQPPSSAPPLCPSTFILYLPHPPYLPNCIPFSPHSPGDWATHTQTHTLQNTNNESACMSITQETRVNLCIDTGQLHHECVRYRLHTHDNWSMSRGCMLRGRKVCVCVCVCVYPHGTQATEVSVIFHPHGWHTVTLLPLHI